MRLVTYHAADELRVAVVHGELVIDIAEWLSPPSEPFPTDMLGLIAMGDRGTVRLHEMLELLPPHALDTAPRLDAVHLAPPIPRPPRNVLCVGHNYAAHLREQGKTLPDKPTIFTKAPSSVIGPHDPIPIDPAVSEQIDWEVELAFVIGVGGRGIKRAQALEHVYGYMVLNDVSARDIQYAHGGQFFLGKSLDASCPIGPWIVTADELGDPQQLEVTARVNGEVKQHAETSDMIFPVADLIEWLSRGMTLERGDIIATGTPGGVGHFRTPPEYLRPGDVLESEVSRIGVLRNPVVAWAGAPA